MARDYLTIGPVPYGEDCAQVGRDDYEERSRLECRVYADMLRRVFGPEPNSARIGVKSFAHDFGSYREVVVHYDTHDFKACEYALKIEGESPEHWDKEARVALGVHVPKGATP